jgi:hypothetical protein
LEVLPDDDTYPQASRFFELKKRYDPELTFKNLFYRKYGVHAPR